MDIMKRARHWVLFVIKGQNFAHFPHNSIPSSWTIFCSFHFGKVEMILEQRYIGCGLITQQNLQNLNFSNVLSDKNAISLCSKIISTLPKYHSYFCSKQQAFSTRKLKRDDPYELLANNCEKNPVKTKEQQNEMRMLPPN